MICKISSCLQLIPKRSLSFQTNAPAGANRNGSRREQKNSAYNKQNWKPQSESRKLNNYAGGTDVVGYSRSDDSKRRAPRFSPASSSSFSRILQDSQADTEDSYALSDLTESMSEPADEVKICGIRPALALREVRRRKKLRIIFLL